MTANISANRGTRTDNPVLRLMINERNKMFLNLDDVLTEKDYLVTDEEVEQAFRDLGYITNEEAQELQQ